MIQKEKKNNIKIAIIFLCLIILIIFAYVLIKNNTSNDDDDDIADNNLDISYDDFKKEYGEYNWEDSEISENNYHLFEDKFFSRKYSKMLECEIKKVNESAFVVLNNTSDEYLGTIETTIIFYDDNDQIIDVQNTYVSELEYGGKTIRSLYEIPQEYARVDFFNKIDKPIEIPKLRVSNIKCELLKDEKSIKITNNNTEECKSVKGIILFYDEFGNVISNSSFYVYEAIKAGKNKIEYLFNYPYSFNSYEILISGIG